MDKGGCRHMAKGYARLRGKNKWQLEVDLGSYVDPSTGKRKRNKKYRTVTAKNQKEADKELIRFVYEVTGDGYYEPEKMNFVDFIEKEWWPKFAEKNLADTTLNVYRYYLKSRIIPAFKYLRIEQIQTKHIIDFLDNLSEEGMRQDKHKDEEGNMVIKDGKLSGATIEYYYRILKSIFKFAKKIKIIKDNPMDDVDKPKVENKKVEVYTLEEAVRILECLENELLHWQIIIKLAITTGMRRSELFGLEFKHFDFNKRIVHVEQALTYTKEKGYQIHEIKKGNGAANKRDIVISESLIPDIKKLQLQRKKERLAAKELWMDGKYNFLLADETGKPFNPSSMKNWWKRFIERHNLKYINIHALRHTSATLLINEGVHAKIISERLGHANIKTTMNIYGHALRQADELATAKLDAALDLNKKVEKRS
jgi:integrase